MADPAAPAHVVQFGSELVGPFATRDDANAYGYREGARRCRAQGGAPVSWSVVPVQPPTGDGDQGREVRTETIPDEEARQHPLHSVIAGALRSGMAPGQPAVVRVWGRKADAPSRGSSDNVWAGTPEDVADDLVRAISDGVPVVGAHGVIPLLSSTLCALDDLRGAPLTARQDDEQ